MRIRQVKPSFWADAKLAALSERARLFYIGLWMLADDAGWLRWDPAEAARDLYGYESRKHREQRVVAMFGEIMGAGRVELHDCGHAFIPTLRDHQRFASADKQVRTIEREHAACPRPPAGVGGEASDSQKRLPRDNPRAPAEARDGTERIGKVREGEGVGGADAPPDGAAARGLPFRYEDAVKSAPR